MTDIKLKGYVPGAIGRVAELHALYYSEHCGFGQYFEAKVATGLSEFLGRFDESRDGFWAACLNHRVEGSLAVDGIKAETEGAHLRWFIMSSALRGRGVGNRLMREAIDFCERVDCSRIYLWTFEGLDPARHLYEKFGFRMAEQFEGTQWGPPVLEQKFVLELK
ncbi:MAG: GNAT family N-acetyltransferase [Deltaproteobacteria bacterium]|nr:GNAT family N-acetyltransferase [Deltaproteobacteria bacterium]MBW1815835.1 GNAT family N-acetyltransferase [Deltaproteobacteria bacterium]MBW2283360.1 GNAT family N-acetyltransferase [Deltaproteobacteria bacterium]